MTDRGNMSGAERTKTIVKVYPFALLVVAVLMDFFAFGVSPLAVAVPLSNVVTSLAVASVLLLINHSWLMTTTELTRLDFNMHATPEEWAANQLSEESASAEGVRELQRHHNAHRNTTENTVYFVFLALIFSAVSPTPAAAWAWIVGFPLARLGYTYCYLKGHTNGRGLFMSLSLLAMYGIASYLLIGLLV